MDLLKKVELLLSAKARLPFSHRRRRSPLDEQEAEILAEIRQALQAVEAKEQELARRLKMEQAEAQKAASQGNLSDQRAHERRAAELEQKLEEESIQAINLEEKLKALEEKLALAKEAVEKEAQKVADRDAAAEKVLARDGGESETVPDAVDPPAGEEIIPDDFSDDDPDLAARKSRLSG